jgi:two-component system, OmpR family, sensor histidine kinase KdpD
VVSGGRKTPEELLREIEGEESRAGRGYLKIFLGYASGVGKSFRMLDEARRRRERGQDVVVGAVQPIAPPDVEALLTKLEVIPLRAGAAIDVERLLARKPAVCFIDGLAYRNPPGSRHATRWQDVTDLLHAGIKVVASINVQYVDELRAEVETLTGKRVSDAVPLAFLQSADEIEIVDAVLETLSRLREIALLLAADVVDRQLQRYLESHGIRQGGVAHERILLCVTPRSNIRAMIETGRIVAEKFHAELIAASVDQPNLAEADRAALAEKLDAARAAGASVEELVGDDAVDAILDFARRRGITQLFIGHTQRSGLALRWRRAPVDRIIERARGMDVRIFPQ